MKLTTALIAGLFTLTAGPVWAADVEAIYTKQCAPCHGKDGSGSTTMGKKVGAKDLRDAKVQAEFTDEKAFKSIKEGVKEKNSDKFAMKPVKDATDEDVKALVAYVRKFKK